MKKVNLILAIFIASSVLVSCEKDDPTVTSSTETVAVSERASNLRRFTGDNCLGSGGSCLPDVNVENYDNFLRWAIWLINLLQDIPPMDSHAVKPLGEDHGLVKNYEAVTKVLSIKHVDAVINGEENIFASYNKETKTIFIVFKDLKGNILEVTPCVM